MAAEDDRYYSRLLAMARDHQSTCRRLLSNAESFEEQLRMLRSEHEGLRREARAVRRCLDRKGMLPAHELEEELKHGEVADLADDGATERPRSGPSNASRWVRSRSGGSARSSVSRGSRDGTPEPGSRPNPRPDTPFPLAAATGASDHDHRGRRGRAGFVHSAGAGGESEATLEVRETSSPSRTVGGVDLYPVCRPLLGKKGEFGSEQQGALKELENILAAGFPTSWSGPGTPLSAAAKAGNVEMAKLLLVGGMGTNECDEKGVTPLHLAAFDGDADMTRVLLAAGASVEAMDCHGQTALFFAPTRRVCRLLVEQFADINVLNYKSQSALHLAGRAGLHDVLGWLCTKASKSLVELRDMYGCTARHYAQHGVTASTPTPEMPTPKHSSARSSLIPRCAEVRMRTQSPVGAAGNARTPAASQGPSRNRTPTPENRVVGSLAGSGSSRGHGQLPTSSRGSGQLAGSPVACGHSPQCARASGTPDGRQHLGGQTQHGPPPAERSTSSRSPTQHLPWQTAKPRQAKAQAVREAEYVRLDRKRAMEDAPAAPANPFAVVSANRTADANKRGPASPGTPSRQRPSAKGSGGTGAGVMAYPQQQAGTRSLQRRSTLEFKLSPGPSQETFKLNTEEVSGSLEIEYEELDRVRSNSSAAGTRGGGGSGCGAGAPAAAAVEGSLVSSGELPSQSSLKLEAAGGGTPVTMLAGVGGAPVGRRRGTRRGSSLAEDETRDSGGSQELEDAATTPPAQAALQGDVAEEKEEGDGGPGPGPTSEGEGCDGDS